MKTRKDMLSRLLDACRLHPVPEAEAASAISPGKYKIRISRRIRLVALTVLLACFFAFPLGFPTGSEYGVTMTIRNGSPIEGTPGVSLEVSALEGRLQTVLVNSTPFDTSSGSYFPFSIALYNVTRLTFNLTATGVTDGVNMSMYIQLRGFAGSYGPAYMPSILLSSGETRVLSYSLPLDEVRAQTASWVINGYCVLPDILGIKVEGFVVEVSSSVKLQPLSLDVRSTDGIGLFVNPYFKHLQSGIPSINITRADSGTNWATVLVSRANETLFLPVGHYVGVAGCSSYHMITNTQPISANVTEDEGIRMILRLPYVKLHLEWSADLPICQLSLGQDGAYYGFDPIPMTADFLYFPRYARFPVTLRIEYLGWVYGSGGLNVDSSASNDLILRTDLSFVQVGNVAVESKTLILLIAAAVVLLALVVELLPSFKGVTRQRLLQNGPTIMFIVGLALPFYSSVSYNWLGDAPVSECALFFPALQSALVWTPEGGTALIRCIPELYDAWISGVTPLIPLTLWIPLVLAVLAMTTDNRGSPDPLSLYIIAGPALLTAIGVYNLSPYTSVPIVGAILVLAAPLTWFIIAAYGRKKTHGRDSGRHAEVQGENMGGSTTQT